MSQYEVLLRETEEALRYFQKENERLQNENQELRTENNSLSNENRELRTENNCLSMEKEKWRSNYELIYHSRGYRMILRVKALLGRL